MPFNLADRSAILIKFFSTKLPFYLESIFFCLVIIDYGKVQSKVSLKYDSWHKDALGKFGNLLGNEMSHFHSQVKTLLTSLMVTNKIQ